MLFDITGKQIKILADMIAEPGEQKIEINLSDIHDGIYFYRVTLNAEPIATGKLIRASEVK
jgi:hypothetical protein